MENSKTQKELFKSFLKIELNSYYGFHQYDQEKAKLITQEGQKIIKKLNGNNK